jgi:hypothetical protein
MVQDDDAVRAFGRRLEALLAATQLALAEAAALMAVRPRRVEADDVE